MTLGLFKLICRILSGILFALTLFSAYGGLFNPDFFTVPAVTLLAFPWLATATAVVTLAWLAGRQLITAATGVVTLLACWGPLETYFPLQTAKEAEPGQQTFKMITWNILHTDDLRPKSPEDTTLRSRAFQYIIDSGADFVCFQEIFGPYTKEYCRWDPAQLRKLDQTYPYYAGGTYNDLYILSKYPVEILGRPVTDDPFRQSYNIFRIHMPGGRELTVADVHLPSFQLSDKERQVITDVKDSQSAKSSAREFKGTILEKLGRAFKTRDEMAEDLIDKLSHYRGALIVCGDFNDVPSSWCYRKFIKAGFTDAFTQTNFWNTHTFNEHLMYFRLDQILYRGPLQALSMERGDIDSSDHYPFTATFAFTDYPAAKDKPSGPNI